jgi:energy-coupling factor transport system permease protein
MIKFFRRGGLRTVQLVDDSPLRKIDPRVKLFASLCVSLAAMLPLEKLAIFMVLYSLFIIWAKIYREVVSQIWRLRWFLLFLFIIDWWLVNLELALVITLRLILLSGVFAIFFATTTPNEFSLALERLRFPYRFAFSINLAFQSVNLLQEEWNAIREAQQSRGVTLKFKGLKQLIHQVRDLVALTVPAIVLTTRRAWAITEAAYARGFDSPERIPYYQLSMKSADWLFFFTITISLVALILWRFL